MTEKVRTAAAAKLIGVSKKTLSRMIDRGEGPAYEQYGNHRLFKLADVEVFIADHRKDRRIHCGAELLAVGICSVCGPLKKTA